MRGDINMRAIFLKFLLASFFLCMLPNVSAYAVILQYRYTSTIDLSVIGGGANDDYIFTYSFDTDELDTDSSSEFGNYKNVFGSVIVGNDTVTFNNASIIVINRESPNTSDQYIVSASGLSGISGTIFGTAVSIINFSLFWSDGGLLVADDIVTDIASLLVPSDGTTNDFFLAQAINGDDFAITQNRDFSLVQLNPVPIPAALPLFGTGLAVIGFIGWRRKQKLG